MNGQAINHNHNSEYFFHYPSSFRRFVPQYLSRSVALSLRSYPVFNASLVKWNVSSGKF